MFRNLRAEMAREGLSGNAVAKEIGITGRSFSSKMQGASEFTRSEMKKVKCLFPKLLTFEYLFDLDVQDSERPIS